MADQHPSSGANPAPRPIVDVAVGVVIRPADGRVLIGQRPPGKPFEGWWEFPGGKFDPGEDAAAATARELDEELGIQVIASQPWVVREHVYEHAHVRLHFRRVTAWRGEPQSREGQAFAWCHPAHVDVEPLLPASLAPIRWLGLPATYAISNASELGQATWLKRLEQWRSTQEEGGFHGLLLLREPLLDAPAFQALFHETLARLKGAGIRLLVSSRHPVSCIAQAAEHTEGGIHLTGDDLRVLHAGQPCAGADVTSSEFPKRPPWPLVAASCHGSTDLQMAGDIGADFAVLGPVLPTRSHPDAPVMGWESFGALIERSPVPVYALGGLQASDLDEACRRGAHGIAMQRAVWAFKGGER